MSNSSGIDPERYLPQELYIEDQVIVTGPEETISALMSSLDSVVAEPVRVLRLSELGKRAVESLPPGQVIALYRLSGDKPDVRKAIDQIGLALGGSKHGVSAEPNYLTGHPWDAEGGPWDAEGGPWDAEGGPWDAEGGPWDAEGGNSTSPKPQPKKVARPAQPEWFMNQWALRSIGLDANCPVSGAGVRVGIFDTSPYYPQLPEGASAGSSVELAQASARMDLRVFHPVKRAHPKPSAKPLPDLRNHGFYVAGLIHAVAPGCDLRLVRVLAHDNRGDLFTLMEAFFDFLKDLVADPPERGAVANFSLCVRVPPRQSHIDLPVEMSALRGLMRAARNLGVVTVAAAGNNAKGAAQPEPAEIPACLETVIGVAASNQAGERSCFSNCGDIAAPGGDGRNGCRPCNADSLDGASPWSLVGPVLNPADLSVGYIFWSGSSFSTPLVAGLAALVLERSAGCLAEAVEAVLRRGATPTGDPALGAGIINVKATLERQFAG